MMVRNKIFLAGVLGFVCLSCLYFLLIYSIEGKLLSIPISIQASPDSGAINYHVPVHLVERFLPEDDAALFIPHLFDEEGKTHPIYWTPQIVPLTGCRITIPIILGPGEMKRFYLEWVDTSQTQNISSFVLPDSIIEPQRGSDGFGIQSWSLQSRQGDERIVPFEGQWMLHLEVIVEPEKADHYTNDVITIPLENQYRVTEKSMLSYAVHYAEDQSLRASVQLAFSDGQNTSEMGLFDSNGLSADWNTPLDDVAVGQWYHRQISLSSLQGKTVDRFIIFVNDSPTIVAEEKQNTPINVHFDAIYFYEGTQTNYATSNPLRELLRAVIASRGFIFFFLSIIYWLLTSVALLYFTANTK